MAVKYGQLVEFTKKIEKLNEKQKEEFLESCCKELAARLLQKVIKRTPVGVYEHKKGGTLRRGWTSEKTGNAVHDTKQALYENMFGGAQKIKRDDIYVRKQGGTYRVDVTNAVEYAAYVEYGHRTRDHKKWVPGKYMLTVSEKELQTTAPQILERKIKKFLEDAIQ